MDKLKRYNVSEETTEETKKCDKDFSCLKGQHEDLCPVKDCVNGKVHFVECLNSTQCLYKTSFGESFICNCPTRKELFNKHKI